MPVHEQLHPRGSLRFRATGRLVSSWGIGRYQHLSP